MLILDIETSSPDPKRPEWALDFNRGKIDLIGLMNIKGEPNYIGPPSVPVHGELTKKYCGHNLKFDLKFLTAKNLCFDPVASFHHDTMLMGIAAIKKIPEWYLERYEIDRQARNKSLPKGVRHRKGGGYSLKTMAPYYLGVPAFWENPANHDDPEYLKKDLEYTLGLYKYFKEELRRDETWSFYEEKLLPWARMIMGAELDGIQIDIPRLEVLEKEALTKQAAALSELNKSWEYVASAYKDLELKKLSTKYAEMVQKALAKPTKKPRTDADTLKVMDRYRAMEGKAIAKVQPFSFSSPSQVLWALQNIWQYPANDFSGKISSGADVLTKLKNEDRRGIAELLDYREYTKLVTSYFPDYKDRIYNERIYCNFNFGPRTGRLSASGPNLQQVPGDLHSIFRAESGNKLICLDLSAIEPALIAYFSEDYNLCRIFLDGIDFHGSCAVFLFGRIDLECGPNEVKKKSPKHRSAAKKGDLSLFYGTGYRKLLASLRLEGMKYTEQQCKQMWYNYRSAQAFKGVFDYKQSLDDHLQDGHVIENLMGRRYIIENPDDIYMKGFNTLIQGSGSDLLLQSVEDTLKECKEKKIPVKLRLLVHDEVVYESPTKYAQKVFDIANKHMTKWKLDTKHGRIPLKTEGKVSDVWEK